MAFEWCCAFVFCFVFSRCCRDSCFWILRDFRFQIAFCRLLLNLTKMLQSYSKSRKSFRTATTQQQPNFPPSLFVRRFVVNFPTLGTRFCVDHRGILGQDGSVVSPLCSAVGSLLSVMDGTVRWCCVAVVLGSHLSLSQPSVLAQRFASIHCWRRVGLVALSSLTQLTNDARGCFHRWDIRGFRRMDVALRATQDPLRR